MKKTIIAAAVAAVAAAPAAFADVSISGNVIADIVTNKNSNGNSTNASDNTEIGSQIAADIVFSASEDLGNGLKASAKIHMLQDNGDGGQVRADETVGLSGDFGSITMGRFEPFVEGQVVSQASFGTASDLLSIENAGLSSGRSNGGFRYVAPSMNGLTVGVEAFSSAPSSGTTADGAASTGNDWHTTAIMAKYSINGLTVTVADENVEGNNNDTTAIAVSYTMGDLTVKAVSQDYEEANKDDVVYGATYTMGANTISVGIKDSDASNADDKIFGVKHNLSKTTWVGLTHFADDSTGVDDQTALTMGMKF